MEKEEQRLFTKKQIEQTVKLSMIIGFLMGVSLVLILDKLGW